MFDANLWLLLGVLLVLAFLAWQRGGSELVMQGLNGGGALLVRYALVLAVSFLAAGFAEVLIPVERVRELLGHEAGLRGIAIGTVAGALTPAGPFISMPVAALLLRSGAGAGPVVAFLAAWSLLSLHRFVAWEVPILGLPFAATRYGLCLGLPVAAGLLARYLVRA